MCNNCIHKIVCSKYIAMGEVNSCEHHKEERKGRWIVLAKFYDGSICTECPVCGEEYTYKAGRLELIGVRYAEYNYCPKCGSNMRGNENG